MKKLSEKCKPEYKNLNRIQSFGEQYYATAQLMKQICMNDEYLKQQVETLEYLSPPAVRKRFSPILVDDNQSWGYQLNSNNEVTFSSVTTKNIVVDFNDMELVDVGNSDCSFETYVDQGGAVNHRAVVPMETTSTVDYNCRNFSQGTQINSFWYVGFDKSKAYQLRPDWLKNWRDIEIPAVCRAQTFTIPKDSNNNNIVNGYLESIDLQLATNGREDTDWASPIYVQIWKVKNKKVEKTDWNKKQKRAVSKNPKQYENIAWPNGSYYNALATCIYSPSKATPGFQNFRFDKAIPVNTGEKYAIVISSPLSHWEHCPRIGGWGRNCAIDKYSGGDAFLSEDNGRTWKRYGRNDTQVEYKYGQLTPQDFAFQCHIRQYSEGRKNEEVHYLYLKPIHDNPIKSIKLSASDYGYSNSVTDMDLDYEVSIDGVDWEPIDKTNLITFSRNELTNEYPRTIFLRAKLSTDDPEITPHIEKLGLTINTELPNEMYVRTLPYYPKVTPMLGASLWGRINAPFDEEAATECSAEIIQDKILTEHFEIITALELSDYTFIEGLDEDKITDEDIDVRYQYLIDNPNAIELLRQHNVYVKPYTKTVEGVETTYGLSFFHYNDSNQKVYTGLKFNNSPAYPIKEALLQPYGDSASVCYYGEWYDYAFDYDEDVLNFYNETGHDILAGIPVGSLSVSYNPVFIQNLQSAEMPLILDYFKENFEVNEDTLESRRVKLRCAPIDPIRSLTLIHADSSEEELYEDVDYRVDYDNNEIIFPVINIDNESSILILKDTVEVVYTPNLEDTGISIGYHAKRTNKDKQVHIKPNYIEYKV